MQSCRHTPVGLGPSAEAGWVQAAPRGMGKVPSAWGEAITHPACAALHGGYMGVQPLRVAPRRLVRPPASCAGFRGPNLNRTDRQKHQHRCRHMQEGWGQAGGENGLREKKKERASVSEGQGWWQNERASVGWTRQSNTQRDMKQVMHPALGLAS